MCCVVLCAGGRAVGVHFLRAFAVCRGFILCLSGQSGVLAVFFCVFAVQTPKKLCWKYHRPVASRGDVPDLHE